MSKLTSLAISTCAISIALLACGAGGTPPPRPAEVAMDPSTGGSTPSTTSADSTPAPAAPSTDGDPSSAMMGGADPSAATPAPAPAPDATPDPKAGKGKGKGKGKKGAAAAGDAGGGGGLSKAECQQLTDKGLDLKLASMGISDPAMAAQAKAQVASDPNLAGMMTECLKSQTRAQYKCGMAATSESAWETCLK